MKAYKRIKKLTEEVEKLIGENDTNLVVADIGADHGYISESLSRIEKISKVFAIEISQKCLKKVIKLKQDFNLSKIEPLLSNGLNKIESADISVMAGIGGYEIINIIKNQNNFNGKNKCDLFVLLPSDNFVELRRWIYENKFKVVTDYVFESAKRFYPIIVIDVSKFETNEPTDFNLYLGRDNSLENEEFIHYLNYLQESLVYIEMLPKERIVADESLVKKSNLKLLIESLLKKC